MAFLLLLPLILLVFPAGVTRCDVFDDAKSRVVALGLAVNGASMATHMGMDVEFAVLSSWSNDVYSKAFLGMMSTESEVIDQIFALKALADSAGVDASGCLTNVSELDAQLEDLSTRMRSCMTDKITDANTALQRTYSLLEEVKTKVVLLSTKIEECESEACLDPLTEFLGVQETALVQKVRLETTRVKSLFDLLKVASTGCTETFSGSYQFKTTMLVSDIDDCVSALLSK